MATICKKKIKRGSIKELNMDYFRITGYCPEHDFCFILDSNGKYEKLWNLVLSLYKKD